MEWSHTQSHVIIELTQGYYQTMGNELPKKFFSPLSQAAQQRRVVIAPPCQPAALGESAGLLYIRIDHELKWNNLLTASFAAGAGGKRTSFSGFGAKFRI